MSSVPKEVLDGFWRLSEAKENVRIEAANKIVEAAQVSSQDKTFFMVCESNLFPCFSAFQGQ